MDLTNISILIIPLGITSLQSGIKLNESHCNFATKFSNGSLFSLLAIILSFMKIMSFEKETIKIHNYSMNGFEFASCFFVIIAVLLMINYIVIDQVQNKILRTILSLLFLIAGLIPSFLIVFYKHFLI